MVGGRNTFALNVGAPSHIPCSHSCHQCFSAYEACLFGASFCLPFFAALRVGELVPPSRARDGGLLADDVVLANSALRIRIRRSKTDVLGRGEWVPLHGFQGPVCPVRVVSEFMAVIY